MKSKIYTFLKGLIIGSTMLVPGVSGGSMAMILGIYEKLIRSVSRFFRQKVESAVFLLIFSAGAFIGMILFSKSIGELLVLYKMPTMYFFIGCIVGGIPMITKECRLERLSIRVAVFPIIGALAVLSITLIPKGLLEDFSTYSIKSVSVLLIAGFLSAVALILPGISVSFVLLVLGLYDKLISAFQHMDIPYLAILGTGLIVGIITTTRIIEKAMSKYSRATYLVILGFVIGSVIPVFPGTPLGIDLLICPITLIVGIAIIQLLYRLETK